MSTTVIPSPTIQRTVYFGLPYGQEPVPEGVELNDKRLRSRKINLEKRKERAMRERSTGNNAEYEQILQEEAQLKKIEEMTREYRAKMYYRKKIQQDNRIVTVSYNYNRITKKLEYGAAIYNESETDKTSNTHKYCNFSKKKHRKTANGRLEKCPVVLTNFEDTGSMDEFHYKLRKAIHKHGVHTSAHKTQA